MKKQTNLPATGRKLSLNKKTISNLSSSEMSKHVGGATTITYTCHCHTYGKENTCNRHKTCYTAWDC